MENRSGYRFGEKHETAELTQNRIFLVRYYDYYLKNSCNEKRLIVYSVKMPKYVLEDPLMVE